MPYFVGPITNTNGKNAWAIKLSKQALKPWNIKHIIDYSQAESEFVNRMVRKCTYMPQYSVLPKKSLLYNEYCVLNELNNLTINGEKISVKLKQLIFDELFKKNKKVTLKQVRDILVVNGLCSEQDAKDIEFGGVDNKFINSLSTYNALCDKFGQEFVENNKEIFEKIIFYSTITSDKVRLQSKIEKDFKMFNKEQIKYLKSLTCDDWGNLSKEFLTNMFVDKATGTGEVTNVISELYKTNLNLMQIISNQNYTIDEMLQQDFKLNLENLTYEALEEIYCSPAVKRGVWQSIKIIKEIVQVMGKMPDKIFVEVTRDEGEKGDKGRTKSRKESLEDLYATALKESSIELTKELNMLINELTGTEDNKLRSETLYLYFLQQGKCMYSGEPINIVDLFSDNRYDVDHIIPQSIIKDDSIDNKVLVKKQLNEEKSDNYPLSAQWIEKNKEFWTSLKKSKFISDKKYQRLIRRDALNQEEIGDFIARQLVETNQSAKAVIEFLKCVVDNPRDVIYSKAARVSDFRQKYDILKCREINDYHHAKDAYLNIVVGNVLFNRFTNNPKYFYADKEKNKNANMSKNVINIFDKELKAFNGDNVVWNPNTHLSIVKNICLKNDCLTSYMSYCDYETNFYDETIYKSLLHDKKSKAKIALKGDGNPISLYEKYGGYNNFSTAYFMVVQSEKQGEKIVTIETVTAYIYKKYKGDTNKILEHISKENGLVNPKIILDRLNIKSTIRIGKGEYLFAGKSSDVYILHNFNQWNASKEINDYVRIIAKYKDLIKDKKEKLITVLENEIIVSDRTKRGNKKLSITKEQNLCLYENIVKQLKKDIYKFPPFLAILKTLEDNFDIFNISLVTEQTDLLFGLIKKLSTGASFVDLTLINGKAKSGILTIGKNITGKDIKVVFKSSTGMFEKTIGIGGNNGI